MEMVRLDGHFPTGRPFALNVPADLTPAEALALTKAIADLPGGLARRGTKPHIIRASHVPGGVGSA